MVRPTRWPPAIGGRLARTCSRGLPELVNWHSITGLIVPALLLLRYNATCQRCEGITVNVALSMLAMGTVGPAVMGTVPIGWTLGVCTLVPCTTVVCAWGLNARFSGRERSVGPRPTFSGVQIWPVTGSRNWGGLGYWARAADITVALRIAEIATKRMAVLHAPTAWATVGLTRSFFLCGLNGSPIPLTLRYACWMPPSG